MDKHSVAGQACESRWLVKARALLRDDQGAIMVVSLVFATFLIGACWFVFGVGDAIEYRENLQNGADATAFAAAVYNARGMNLIAMINLVMASVLAVLVVVRIVQAIVFAVQLVSCAAGGPINPICVATTAVVPVGHGRWATSSTLPSYRLCCTLHYTESGIGVVWPWISEGKSSSASLDYQPGVIVGTSWATAQIPMSLDQPLDYANLGIASLLAKIPSLARYGGNPFRTASGLFKGDANFYGRFGLPVMNDPYGYADVCSMASRVAFDVLVLDSPPILALSWIPAVKKALNVVGNGLAYLAGNGSFFFCDGEGGIASSRNRFYPPADCGPAETTTTRATW